MTLEAIILDLDGTLVNSTEVQWYAFNKYLKQYDIEIPWSTWTQEYLGKKSDNIWKAVLAENPAVSFDIQDAQQQRRAYYRAFVSEGKLTEIPGFSDFYTWLTQTSNIPVVIASNGHPTSIETSLKKIGYFNQIEYYSAHTQHSSHKVSKVHLLKRVVADLHVDPSNCVMVEDSPLGATAAKEHGMNVIIINTSQLPIDSFEADLIVEDFTDDSLQSYITELLKQT